MFTNPGLVCWLVFGISKRHRSARSVGTQRAVCPSVCENDVEEVLFLKGWWFKSQLLLSTVHDWSPLDQDTEPKTRQCLAWRQPPIGGRPREWVCRCKTFCVTVKATKHSLFAISYGFRKGEVLVIEQYSLVWQKPRKQNVHFNSFNGVK